MERQHSRVERIQADGGKDLGSNNGSYTYWQGDLGQTTESF